MVEYSAQTKAPALTRGTGASPFDLQAEIVEKLLDLAIGRFLYEAIFLSRSCILGDLNLELPTDLAAHRFSVPSLIATAYSRSPGEGRTFFAISRRLSSA